MTPTLAEIADRLEHCPITGFDGYAAAVRSAIETLKRCEEKLQHSCFCRATMPLGTHGKHCKTKDTIAEIRRLLGDKNE